MSETPPPRATLLNYSFATLPDPLQVNTAASLTLTVDGAGATVTCQRIVVTVPRGTNADDLVGAVAINAVPPPGWTVEQDGGITIFHAPGGSVEIKGGGLVFAFAVTINGKPGAALVTIDETASSPGMPLTKRTTYWTAAKFPIDFSLSALTAVPITNTDLAYGDTAQLTWTVTGAGVTCMLDYQPADSGTPVSVLVPNSPVGGIYVTDSLTRSQQVVFTLTAQVDVDGQDQPLIRQSQLTVTVESLSLSVTVQPPRIGPGGISLVSWDAPNADHCLTDHGDVLPTSGNAYVLLQETYNVTVTAVGTGGQTKQQSAEIKVDPTIVPTEAGYILVGTAGQPGGTGANVSISSDPSWQNWVYTINGTPVAVQITATGANITIDGVTRPATAADWTAYQQALSPPGGSGGDAVFTTALPPLDLVGDSTRVIPVTVTGGAGGQGGPGGQVSYVDGAAGGQGPGGSGGAGGNARVEAAVDGTQQPAQYIFALAGGPGGTVGPGTPDPLNGPGAPGTVTAMAFGGLVVPLSGLLKPPVPFEPLALTLTAAPATVPVNGLVLLTWSSPNADHCALPDGSTVPPNGSRYLVVAETLEYQVSAFDNFARTTQTSATITVDPSIKPTETGSTQAGATGATGADGTNGSWTFDLNPPIVMPSASTAGGGGGTGGDATLALSIPPLDINGTSTRVIPIVATGGAGGPGGVGGCLTIVGAPTPPCPPSPFDVQIPQFSSAGGPGGNGGNASIALTFDPSQPPARFIIQATAGAAGTGGESGWRYDTNGNNVTSYAADGSQGTASLTIGGVVVALP